MTQITHKVTNSIVVLPVMLIMQPFPVRNGFARLNKKCPYKSDMAQEIQTEYFLQGH